MSADRAWDDIIVGAGSAGAVLASRLSDRPDRRVLLLEAGPDFASPEETPAELMNARAAVASGYNWDYAANVGSSGLFQSLLQSADIAAVAPRDMLSEAAAVRSSRLASTLRQFPYFPGKVVGGSSAVNSALALRGYKEDFDQWSTQGNTQWRWEDVLPYYKKLETDHDFADPLHGAEGPIPITRPNLLHLDPLQAAFLEGCRGWGFSEVADLNGGSAPGVGPLPSNSIEHTRVSTALAYLVRVRDQSNLTIRGDCTVKRVLFEGRRAIGVELLTDGESRFVLGKRITLSAGAVNTVAVLLRSGVGNGKLCSSLGVPCVIDLPGVGENLMDHASVMIWMTPNAATNRPQPERHQIMARAASHSDQPSDIGLYILGNVATDSVPMLRELLRAPFAHAVSVVLTRPVSRGRVFLKTVAPDSEPVIDLNLASAPEDMERLMYGMRLAWKILRSRPIAERTQSVFMWTDAIVNNDSVLKSAISRFIGSAWHAAGTAKMGPVADPTAVVDQRCRVHGSENLRVVDASVLPLIPSAPTNLTCIMLAERVADWMLQEQQGSNRVQLLSSFTL